MQSKVAILEWSQTNDWDRLKRLRAILIRFLTSLFGCWHREMSRPFTRGGQTYRACLGCGARRRFDLEGWEMSGHYYFVREV